MARKSRKRQDVLDAMLELIVDNGFHATPMSLVAERAQVGAGTIYRYFASKEELINVLYAELRAQMSSALMMNDDVSLSMRDRFYRFWHNLYFYFTENPRVFNFLEQYSNSTFVHSNHKEDNDRCFSAMYSFFLEGMEKRILKEMPVELMRTIVYGGIVSLVKLHFTKEIEVDGNCLQKAFESYWSAVQYTEY